MNRKKQLILVGGGGHCASCIDVIESHGQFVIVGIVDTEEKRGQAVLGYSIIASDADLPALVKAHHYFLITLGHIKNAAKRVETFQLLKRLGAQLPVIVSPGARVSKHATLGEGTIVMHHAMVNACAKVGNNCIVNSGALIEHDALVGDHCHVSTRSVMNGSCQLGEQSFLGSNSVMVNNTTIAPSCVIGSGTVVTHSITEQGTYVGNPFRKIQ